MADKFTFFYFVQSNENDRQRSKKKRARGIEEESREYMRGSLPADQTNLGRQE
jgi:hypothetical protein